MLAVRHRRLAIPALVLAAVLLLWASRSAVATPIVTTGTPTDVTTNSATLHGTIDPQGEDVPYEFQYIDGNGRLNDGYYHETAGAGMLSAASGPTDVSVTVRLGTGTPYYFRLVAAGIPGETRVFGTAAAAPYASIEHVGSVDETSVYIRGSVSAAGIPTDFHYEYGTTAAYGTSTAQVEHTPPPMCSIDPLPTPPAPVPAPYNYQSPLECWVMEIGDAFASGVQLAGLQPGTTYHVRLIASNAIGTTVTPDTTFTTAGTAPAVPEPTPPPRPPTLAGIPHVGGVLSCRTDAVDVYAYAWLRDGERIPRATGRRYRLQPADDGHDVTCRTELYVGYVHTVLTSDALHVTESTEPTLVSKAAIVDAAGRTTVRLSCSDRSDSCRGALTVRLRRHGRRTLVLARADVVVAPGATARVHLRLTTAARHALDAAAHGRLHTQVTLGAVRSSLTLRRG